MAFPEKYSMASIPIADMTRGAASRQMNRLAEPISQSSHAPRPISKAAPICAEIRNFKFASRNRFNANSEPATTTISVQGTANRQAKGGFLVNQSGKQLTTMNMPGQKKVFQSPSSDVLP